MATARPINEGCPLIPCAKAESSMLLRQTAQAAGLRDTQCCGVRLLDAAVICAVSLACDDGFIGDGLVGVASERSISSSGTYIKPRPTVMNLALNQKLKAQIAVLDSLAVVGPRAKEVFLVVRIGHVRPRHRATKNERIRTDTCPIMKRGEIRRLSIVRLNDAVRANKTICLHGIPRAICCIQNRCGYCEISDSIVVEIKRNERDTLVRRSVNNFGLGCPW